MELQVLEGTLAEVQQQLQDLSFAPNERLRVIVTPAQALSTNTTGSATGRALSLPIELRNGVPLLPRREVQEPVTLELVKRLLDEDDVELLHADRTAGHQRPPGNDRPDAPPS